MQLARDLTSIAFLSRIEANERRPSEALLAGLADRLQLEPDRLAQGESRAAEGLRFELAHADFLICSGHLSEAIRVSRDLGEVAQDLGSVRVSHAARVVQASALRAEGHPEAALRILRSMYDGPAGLSALIAAARCHLVLADVARAIAVGRQAVDRLSSEHALSASEGADLAETLCAAFVAIGRPGAAAHVATLALPYLPADSDVQDVDLTAVRVGPGVSAHPTLDKLVRNMERTVATHLLAKLRTDIARLRTYAAPAVFACGASRAGHDRFALVGEG